MVMAAKTVEEYGAHCTSPTVSPSDRLSCGSDRSCRQILTVQSHEQLMNTCGWNLLKQEPSVARVRGSVRACVRACLRAWYQGAGQRRKMPR